MRKYVLILRKELLVAIRDKRSFILTLVIPLLLYPMLFATMGYFTHINRIRENKTIYALGIVNQELDPVLVAHIDNSNRFEIFTGNDVSAIFDANGAKIVLQIDDCEDEKRIGIYYDGADNSSQKALEIINTVIGEYITTIVIHDITEYGLPAKILEPIVIEENNIATPERMGGFKLGMIIPYLLILLSFSGGMSMATDITAGEKERRTLETLLVTNVRRADIVIGKMLAVFTISLMATLSALIGLLATFYTGIAVYNTAEAAISLAIPWLSCLLMLLVMLPLIGLFSTLLILICSASKTVKEAENFTSYILFIILLLAAISMIRLTSPAWFLYFIPVLNTAVLQQQILVGDFNFMNLVYTATSSIIYGMIAYKLAIHCFQKEEILFRS